MLKYLLTLLTFCLFTTPVMGCLWDRDTLNAEADGRTEVINAIIGNYDQFPPEYYQHRVDRVTEEHKSQPNSLELYDDLGVAWDRLGKSDLAIEVMKTKNEVLEQLGESHPDYSEHQYRYLANIGTFHIHRWFQNGKNFNEKEDLLIGRDFIDEAIKLNPDAHFGREVYQLMIVDWLIDMGKESRWNVLSSHQELFFSDNPNSEENIAKSIVGLTGIITIGSGSESIELFNTLSYQLQREDSNSVAYLAFQRSVELLAEGKNFILSDYITSEEKEYYRSSFHSHIEDTAPLYKWYKKARLQAKESNSNRINYLMRMLQNKQHPDTHPEIWKRAPARDSLPAYPGSIWNPAFTDYQSKVVFFIIFWAIIVVLVNVIVRKIKRMKNKIITSNPYGI